MGSCHNDTDEIDMHLTLISGRTVSCPVVRQGQQTLNHSIDRVRPILCNTELLCSSDSFGRPLSHKPRKKSSRALTKDLPHVKIGEYEKTLLPIDISFQRDHTRLLKSAIPLPIERICYQNSMKNALPTIAIDAWTILLFAAI
mmetsp:Transcript_26341/g.55275  ORF Transcript_26341/g.55275 Transcript_26341/m.55275 type:complete len:143 (+) Transcript_26341:331-759(+)